MATIEITKDVEELLEAARKENPAQSEAEIIKRALSRFHREELERRLKWAESLPMLELSDEEKRSVAEARKGEFVEMTVAELERAASSESPFAAYAGKLSKGTGRSARDIVEELRKARGW